MPDSSCTIVLLAPLSGTALPLEEAPDPVFSRKIIGDGIALAPSSNVLLAPCGGTITQAHASSHALTLTSPEGLQVLLHVGIETVSLQGRGFFPKVVPGAVVKAGDPLVEFDLEYLEQAARSAMTMMIIANGELVEAYRPATGKVEAGRSPALELVLRKRGDVALRQDGGTAQSEPLLIRNPQGLHARPAAVLAARARQFVSDVALAKEGRETNAKSVTGIMALDVKFHDRVTFRAAGPDAEAAVAALVPLVESGLGDSALARPEEKKEAPRRETGGALAFRGISASPGMASGPVFQWRRLPMEAAGQGRGQEHEEAALASALDAARKELDLLRDQWREKADPGNAGIFAVHEELLDDPDLLRLVREGITAGQSAANAWQKACAARAELLGGLGNSLLAGRADDIRDVGRRVFLLLTGQSSQQAEVPQNAILIAEELTPSETAKLDAERVGGLCVTSGSATSHAAFLAQSMGIPAIAAMEARALDIPDGVPALIDGTGGILRIHPDEQEMRRVSANRESAAKKRERDFATSAALAITADGRRIKVMGNMNGGVAEAEKILRNGGEGVGLLRSEFLLLNRADAPSEEEQATIYSAVARTLGPERDLVVRTLDVGGDKPLPHLPLPAETNPFLGMRGIRLNRLGTELFAAQVRAILSAAPFTRLHVMFPMVATAEELREAKGIVEREKAALGLTAPVSVGIMVEVPSAALLADNLAWEADFFSIGTNDLAQYTLAADRGHPGLADMADGLHPAVLRLIAATVEGAHRQGKWVGVCGGLAGDPAAVPVLIGLGVDELSVSAESIPATKSLIRGQSRERCAILAADALTMLTATEVRRYLEVFPTEAG